MEFVVKGGVLTIMPEGVIDSNNAEQVGAEFDQIRSNNEHDTVVLDFAKMNYVSSAGLRQILRLKKLYQDFKVINVSSEIYEVFDMTGFSEMMTIEKAYREFSVEGCEKIGEGSNGIVYRVSPDLIIKVYKNPDALEDIKRERELARTALVLGVNTAIPFDVVKVGDKFGSVFELLDAKSLTKLINADPSKMEEYIKVFVDVLKNIHNTEVKDGILPSAKEKALSWVTWLDGKIPQDTYDKLFSMMNAVPESNRMIHGDYHTNNLHYANGEAIIIDMDTLAVGNPIFDFASIFLAFQGFGELDHENIKNFLHLDWDTAGVIWNRTLEVYFEGKDSAFIEDMKYKAMTVGFTRLLRRTMKRTPELTDQIEHCKQRLIESVNKVSSLEV